MSRFVRVVAIGPLVALALVAPAACAPRASEGTSASSGGRRSPDVITAEEITKANASNAYHAIELLRPNFLRSRGPASMSSGAAAVPVAYVNGQRWGELGSLRNLPTQDILSVRRISAAEAQSRYGINNIGGAIEVTTRTGGRP